MIRSASLTICRTLDGAVVPMPTSVFAVAKGCLLILLRQVNGRQVVTLNYCLITTDAKVIVKKDCF